MNEQFELKFLHPTKSVPPYVATVSGKCPAKVALQQLMSPATNCFLPPAPSGTSYELVVERTSKAIAPNQTMTEAQVVNGDVIAVQQRHQGA